MSTSRQDWQAWHRDYDDPDSSVSRRLVRYARRLAALLAEGDEPGAAAQPVLRRRPRHVPVLASPRTGRWTPVWSSSTRSSPMRVAGRGRGGTAPRGPNRRRRGSSTRSADRLPVDVLMLVGVLGNVSDADAERTVAPRRLVGAGRHGDLVAEQPLPPEPTHGYADPAEWVRDRSRQRGFEEVAFLAPTMRRTGSAVPARRPDHGWVPGSFTFTGRSARGAMPGEALFSESLCADVGAARACEPAARGCRRTARARRGDGGVDAVARLASACGDDLVGVAERDPVLGELVLVVDARPGRSIAADRRRGRGRRRAATGPSQTGGVVMSTYTADAAPPGAWKVASHPRSASAAPAPGPARPGRARRAQVDARADHPGAGRDADPVAVLVAAEPLPGNCQCGRSPHLVISIRTGSPSSNATRRPYPSTLGRLGALGHGGDDVLVAGAGEPGEVVEGVGVEADQHAGPCRRGCPSRR